MAEFVPPFPPRPAKALSVLDLLRRGTSDFLGIFDQRSYEHHTMSTQILTRQLFVCNSPASVAEAFVQKHQNFSRKSSQLRAGLAPLVGDGLTVSDGATWDARRPVVQTVLDKYRPRHLPAVLDAVAKLEAEWAPGAKVDMLAAMRLHSARMLGRMLFGPAFDDATAKAVAAALVDFERHTEQGDLKQLLGVTSWIPWRRSSPLAASAAAVHAIFDRLIASARNQPCMAAMLAATGRLDPVAQRNELLSLFLGGHESIAALLTWSLYLLSQAPDEEARLLREVETLFADRAPELSDLKAMTYTRAVVSETLRLYPPVPVLVRQAEREDTISDRKVQAGALVVVIPWLLHRHRHFWAAADTFRPSRFLPGAPRHANRDAYVPFSTGPRECPAVVLGLSEAMLSLALLVQRFRFAVEPGRTVMPVCRYSILPGSDLPMIVQPRSGDRLPRSIGAPPGAGSHAPPVDVS